MQGYDILLFCVPIAPYTKWRLQSTKDSHSIKTAAMEVVKTCSKANKIEATDLDKTHSDSGYEISPVNSTGYGESIQETSTSSVDIVVLRKNPNKRNIINKSVYVKLHRPASSPNYHVDKLKERYEGTFNDDNETKTQRTTSNLDQNTSISPSKSKLPIAKPRRNLRNLKQLDKHKIRSSFPGNRKDENSNELFRKTSSSSEEFVTIITRSESEASVDKFAKELSLFTMERTKDKKRSNSFKKIFSAKIFSKDKKKKDSVVNKDNLQNEANSFTRQSRHRHTIGGNSNLSQENKENKITRHESERLARQQQLNMKEIEERYAKIHVQEFNHIKNNFENQHPQSRDGYVPMDKPINTPGPISYINMPNVNKYIDTSSSNSTAESVGCNIYQNDGQISNYEREITHQEQNIGTSYPSPNLMPKISPKSKIPVQNKTKLYKSPLVLDDTYGTVFDNAVHSTSKKNSLRRSESLSSSLKDSRIPEPTKLKLPPNRQIVPLSPKVRSPIPHDSVSTEKIIATELLKPTRSPTPSQRNPKNSETVYLVTSKPPISRGPLHKSPDFSSTDIYDSIPKTSHYSPAFDSKRFSQPSPLHDGLKINQTPSLTDSMDKIVTNAMVHVNSYARSPTPNSLSHSPIRSTSVEMRISPSVKAHSPQKEDMRKSVEAYYWKELKKLKEQENLDLYYQMNMIPHGYTEDPVTIRRSRSLLPGCERNSRRSLSLPRDPKSHNETVDSYGRIQHDPIPEGRAVINRNSPQYYQHFRRNVPERQTVDIPRGSNSSKGLYRPIFKRGSLTTPVKDLMEDQQYKKVSFSNYKGTPQRFINANGVFLPSTPQAYNYEAQGNINTDYYPRNVLPAQRFYRQEILPNSNVHFRQAPQEESYRQPVDSIKSPYVLTRNGSVQLQEPIYGHRAPFVRKTSYDGNQVRPQRLQRREIILNDEIFGQFGGYLPPNEDPYAVKQESLYGYSGTPTRVVVNNKVCDIYGQIHDRDSPSVVRRSGVLFGQLQTNEHFQRNTRLTASANDMHRRHEYADPRYRSDTIHQQDNGPPTRPLPPVPTGKSEDDNISLVRETLRQGNDNARNKKRGFFGK